MHPQKLLAGKVEGLDAVVGEEPVGRLGRAQRQQVGVVKLRHEARVVSGASSTLVDLRVV
jgi:hypothetical protein